MILPDTLSWLVAAPLLVVNLVLLVELTLGLLPASRRRRDADARARPIRTVVLIPAHDEEDGIAETLGRLLPDLADGTSVLVVADNCSDGTAAIARSLGVRVIERHDPARRGKGFALAFGRDYLRAEAPEVVIVLDADCFVEPGSLDRLSQAAAGGDTVVVGCILLTPSPGAAPAVQISGFAMLVKNRLRQLGLSRLGVPVVLTGTGATFPWRIFDAAPLATDDIVEDLGLGITLATAGEDIVFDPAARIWSRPSTQGGTLEQRTRWEKGFLATAAHRALPLIRRGLADGRGALIWLGLHLLVPPVALLVLLNVAALGLLFATAALGVSATAPTALLAMFAAVAAALAIAWARHGQAQLPASAVFRIPGYLLWKLPIYISALRRRRTGWTRTQRLPAGDATGGKPGHSRIRPVNDDDRQP